MFKNCLIQMQKVLPVPEGPYTTIKVRARRDFQVGGKRGKIPVKAGEVFTTNLPTDGFFYVLTLSGVFGGCELNATDWEKVQ